MDKPENCLNQTMDKPESCINQTMVHCLVYTVFWFIQCLV
jgi:hypothetical protein